MSDTATLKAQVRQQAGSKVAARLRQQGQLPAIVYGHKQDPVSVTLATHEFLEALHHGHRLFNVDLDGRKETLLVKDIQYDHLGIDVIHADFMRVNLSERLTVQVGVELRGIAKGTHEGGIIDEVLSHVDIECKVSDIPEVLFVNIKDLGLGESVHAAQVELPEGAKLITDPDAVIAVCHEAKAAIAAEELEGGAGAEGVSEPEVITEKKTQEASE
jgi:large subunit ribosomal protein L25